ncbi:MAG TPA: methionyl-tRNA formyltransferase [Clostridiaceae bacterium]|nr:methionyl-tRNA formyltransferase [Clostridiaceae bacterium]
MGTPEFAVPSLDMLVKEGYNVAAVVTQPDKPKGRGKKLSAPPVKEYALEKGIRVLQPEKVKTSEFVNELKSINPDLLITAAYGKILPADVLDIPKFGCINVHASLLPKYRGAAPINWAIINGEKVTGITTMYTDIGMDTGDILLKSEVEITDDMTAGELHDKLAVLGAEVLKETLKELQNGTLKRFPQSDEEATYAPMIQKDIGKIDWTKSAREIHNLVRGTNPWPGAFSFYKGERMRIWKTRFSHNMADAAAQDGVSRNNKPGTICRIEKEMLRVVTGDGILDILEIQFDNGRRMSIQECWHNMDEGEVLG